MNHSKLIPSSKINEVKEYFNQHFGKSSSGMYQSELRVRFQLKGGATHITMPISIKIEEKQKLSEITLKVNPLCI